MQSTRAFNEQERSFIHNSDATSYMETLAEMADSPLWTNWCLGDRQVRAHSIWYAIQSYRLEQKRMRTPAATSAIRMISLRCA
jgi:hypothetical protein